MSAHNSSSMISRILRNIGKSLVLLIGVWLLLIACVIFSMKGIHTVLLTVYAGVSLICLIGLLWPGFVSRFSHATPSRAFVFKWFGVPATLLLVGFYFAVVFYIQDLPVILGLLFGAVAIVFIATLIRPQAFGRRGEGRNARVWTTLCGGAAAVLLVLFLISGPVVANYRAARFARAAQTRNAVIQATSALPGVHNSSVRVYPLHVGDAVVAYGQFYGGLAGWEGLGGYFQTLVNKDTIRVPIYAYLIDHPTHGVMLVDAAINWEQAHDHDGYYNHNYMISRLLLERNEYKLVPEQEMEVQLARLGYRLEDVQRVFVTHVHEDHVAGLRLFPDAAVVLGREDWEQGVLYPYSFEFAEDRLELVSYDSGAFGNFSASQDYFGDGSVVLLPTPGHSPGHTSIVLQMDGYQMLFVGDTIYTLPHLALDQIRQLMLGGEETERQIEVIRRIQQLVEAQPETVLLFAHDNTDYQYTLIEPFLADGTLSEAERQQINAYETGIFPDGWQLAPGNLPYFIRPSGSQDTGTVGFR